MAQQWGLCVRFHKAVELIGRRWSGAVIQVLMQGRARYAQLRASIPDISDRMLSERLRELEDEEIVARIVVPATPVRVEYELTEKGKALGPALGAIGQWAERWLPADATPTSSGTARRQARARAASTSVAPVSSPRPTAAARRQSPAARQRT
jgi:DNA-binding HxlR family transcriptional regulator